MPKYSLPRLLAFSLLITAATGCSATRSAIERVDGRLDRSAVAVVGTSQTPGMDPIATAAYWGTRHDREPGNVEVAVEFSRSLRQIENAPESLRVINRVATISPDNPVILLELGKSLIANERPHEAVRQIEQSIALGQSDDWSAFSAYGIALDMTGRHRLARAQYDRALSLSPDRAEILNNKGLSYALQGNRQLAERTLRTATTSPGGTARIRQNFALVLALSGNTAEAERLARSDLPPLIANNNVNYFRTLVAQPAYWPDLRTADAELPDFGDDPNTVSFTPTSQPILEGDPAVRRQPSRPRPAQRPTTPAPTPAPQAPAPATDDPAPLTRSGVSASNTVEDGPIVGSPAPGLTDDAAPQDDADIIASANNLPVPLAPTPLAYDETSGGS